MAAQTATSRISPSLVQRLYNLHQELSGNGTTKMTGNTTTTITLVHTTSTNAVTVDSSTT